MLQHYFIRQTQTNYESIAFGSHDKHQIVLNQTFSQLLYQSIRISFRFFVTELRIQIIINHTSSAVF